MASAQKKKIDAYEMTGAQKKTHADSQKTREYEVTGAQKTEDAYKLMDSQKTREYETRCVQADGFTENS